MFQKSNLPRLSATEINHATSADQDQPKHPCRQIMICTARFSVSSYFGILTLNDKWLWPD
jgi:hypothetical protein